MSNEKNVYKNGLFTGIYKGDNGNMLTATHMIYEVNGDEVIVEIENDFKLLYTFLYDQYRSFQSQEKDLFQEWETIFMALGRTYNTKSKAMVKLLEQCGLLKQIKMPNSNARIKIVADVSLKNIRFVNPSYDAWVAQQAANNAERVEEYKKFQEEKQTLKDEANKIEVEIKQIKTPTKKHTVKSVVKQSKPVDIKQTNNYNNYMEPESSVFCSNCGRTHEDCICEIPF